MGLSQERQAGVLEQSPFRDGDNLVNVGNESADGDNGLFIIGAGSVAESYVKGDFQIEITIKFCGVADVQNYVAIFHKAAGVLRKIKEMKYPVSGGPYLWRNSDFRICGPYWNDQSVLVRQVQGVKLPERGVPSLVWLQSEEEFSRSGASLRRFVSDLSFDPDAVLADWKAGTLDVPATLTDEFSDHMVKSRSGVVDSIASDHGEFDGSVGKLLGAISALPIFFLDVDSIRLASVEFPDFGFKISKVAFRPLYFGAGRGPWFKVSGNHVEESDPGLLWEPNAA